MVVYNKWTDKIKNIYFWRNKIKGVYAGNNEVYYLHVTTVSYTWNSAYIWDSTNLIISLSWWIKFWAIWTISSNNSNITMSGATINSSWQLLIPVTWKLQWDSIITLSWDFKTSTMQSLEITNKVIFTTKKIASIIEHPTLPDPRYAILLRGDFTNSAASWYTSSWTVWTWIISASWWKFWKWYYYNNERIRPLWTLSLSYWVTSWTLNFWVSLTDWIPSTYNQHIIWTPSSYSFIRLVYSWTTKMLSIYSYWVTYWTIDISNWDNNRKMITIVFERSKSIKLYINSILAFESSISNLSLLSGQTNITWSSSSNEESRLRLSEIIIWNEQYLTQKQINDLYDWWEWLPYN